MLAAFIGKAGQRADDLDAVALRKVRDRIERAAPHQLGDKVSRGGIEILLVLCERAGNELAVHHLA